MPKLLSVRCSLEDDACGKEHKGCQEKYAECLNKCDKHKKSKLIDRQIRSKECVVNEIQNLKNGAFSPLISFNNPIIMPILTPLGVWDQFN